MNQNTASGVGAATVELYLIGFRSGRQLTVKLRDGKEFLSELVDGMKRNPQANVQWFMGSGLLFNVSEITYVLPVSFVHDNPTGSENRSSSLGE